MDWSELSAITAEFIVKSTCIGFWLQWQVPNLLDLYLDSVSDDPQTCLNYLACKPVVSTHIICEGLSVMQKNWLAGS